MANIICLDQASKITGYAIFDNNELINYGCFTCNDERLEIRLVKVKANVLNLVKKYNPSKIYLEDIQYQTNIASGITTYRALAEVIGVITELLAELDIPFEFVHSQSWKSTCQIKGKTRAQQKAGARSFVMQTYGIQPTQDAVDAICIGTHVLKQNSCAWAN